MPVTCFKKGNKQDLSQNGYNDEDDDNVDDDDDGSAKKNENVAASSLCEELRLP